VNVTSAADGMTRKALAAKGWSLVDAQPAQRESERVLAGRPARQMLFALLFARIAWASRNADDDDEAKVPRKQRPNELECRRRRPMGRATGKSRRQFRSPRRCLQLAPAV
jgi:hypothetical protein